MTLASPDGRHVSVILEKLEGSCQYCAGPQEPTQTETVTLCLSHAANLDLPAGAGALVQWRTTNQSWFQRGPDVTLARGTDTSCEYTATVEVERDSIITVSTISNATHGTFGASERDGRGTTLNALNQTGSGAVAPFPLPYSENFESRPLGSFPRYFADNGGSFELAPNPVREEGVSAQVLKQAVQKLAVQNAWTKNVQPMTMIGDANWSTIETSVEVLLEAPATAVAGSGDAAAAAAAYAGVCQRVTGGGGQISNTATQALCLSVFGNGSWVLGGGPWNGAPVIPPLATGTIPPARPGGLAAATATGLWHRLTLSEPAPDRVRAVVDGKVVADLPVNASSACGPKVVCSGEGRVALVSGFTAAFFDNFTVQAASRDPQDAVWSEYDE